ERGDRAQHPLPRARDRALVARRVGLRDPPPAGGGVRLRPAAWVRLRERAPRGPPAPPGGPRRAPGGPRRGAGPGARLRRTRARARALLPRAGGALAALGRGPARVHRRLARRVLDAPARGAALRGRALRRRLRAPAALALALALRPTPAGAHLNATG